MKLRSATKKQINEQARRLCWGGMHHVEVCERTGLCGHYEHNSRRPIDNVLLFGECESDLWGTLPLGRVKEVMDHESGRAVLDLYVYGRGSFGPTDLELKETLTAIIESDGSARVTKDYYGDVVDKLNE